jgi:hypothetical protein
MNNSYSRATLPKSLVLKSLRRASYLLAAALLAGAPMLAPHLLNAQENDSSKKSSGVNAGITISETATAKEVGLPIYPGAKAHKDPKDDSSSANLGLWGGSFGFKLVVLKMESSDSPDKVAAFYRKALAKYGPVLDCTNPPAKKADEDDKSTKLTCGDDKAEAGGQTFKAGTKEKQHVVGIQPAATGTAFQLVYVEARGTEQEAK